MIDVLGEPLVSLVVRRRVVEGDQVVLESPGDHFEIHAPAERQPIEVNVFATV